MKKITTEIFITRAIKKHSKFCNYSTSGHRHSKNFLEKTNLLKHRDEKFLQIYIKTSTLYSKKIKHPNLSRHKAKYHGSKIVTQIHLSKKVLKLSGFVKEKQETIYPQFSKWNPCIKSEPRWERELESFLKENKIRYIRNDQRLIKPKELDFYLPDHDLAIELHGLYWHSDVLLEKKNINPKTYHLNKYLMCKERNIQLIQVFEDEWAYKKETILNILKNKLIYKKYTNKYITEVSFSHPIDMISRVKIELKCQDKTIQSIVFNKVRNNYELFIENLASLEHTQELFEYFIKKYSPNNIISRCDLRWNTGKLYEDLGFNHVENIIPDFYYVKNNKRVSNIIPANLPKIYDVGTSVWKWKCANI